MTLYLQCKECKCISRDIQVADNHVCKKAGLGNGLAAVFASTRSYIIVNSTD